MTAARIGFWLGPALFAATLLLPPPAGMAPQAWWMAGLVGWVAAWWMTEALPLSVTALLPFAIIPLTGAMDAKAAASAYYSDIIFLLLGGAFIALAIERTGLHRRLALFLLGLAGAGGGPFRLLLAVMVATAALSMVISNTSTALIMMPVALAVLAGGGMAEGEQDGMSGALPMGIAFAASIGGLGTLVGSPTNAIAVGLVDEALGLRIGFAQWSLYGLPLVLVSVPLAAWLIGRVQNIAAHPFDSAAARAAVGRHGAWSSAERRLVPVVATTFVLWMAQPLLDPLLPDGALTEGGVAVVASLALFMLPDGAGRPLLTWAEAERAPWGVLLMFGGGLALAAGMGASGLADWIGRQLLPLEALPIIATAAIIVALVIVITEFASNVAVASGFIPVVAALIPALGADPLLLAMPVAMAASWGFALPAGTGPNAIAWSTGRLALPRLIRAGLALDAAGVVLIVGTVVLVSWATA